MTLNASGHQLNQLTLYYQSRCYSWNELCFQIKKTVAVDIPANNAEQVDIVWTDSEQVFNCVLTILYGFIENKTVFPAISKQGHFDGVNAALAIATSGSQAIPKIALLSRENITAHCHNLGKIIPLNHSSVWLNCMPLNHIAGVMIIYRCWFNHASMILHDGFCEEKIWQDINDYSVTHISLVPRMLFKLLEISRNMIPPPSLKSVIVGGDRLSDVLYQRAVSSGWPIMISYGMTEATSTIALGNTPEQLTLLDGLIGDLTPEGVFKIKGDMIFSGYADNKTADNQSNVFQNGWFITHDKAKLDNNSLSIIGRNDYMIISGGKNIAPEFIESLLVVSELIEDCAIGKFQYENQLSNIQTYSKQAWGDTIVALYCAKSGVERQQVEAWIKGNIQAIYQPRVLLSVAHIARNSMGKIDRKTVQRIISNQSIDP